MRKMASNHVYLLGRSATRKCSDEGATSQYRPQLSKYCSCTAPSPHWSSHWALTCHTPFGRTPLPCRRPGRRSGGSEWGCSPPLQKKTYPTIHIMFREHDIALQYSTWSAVQKQSCRCIWGALAKDLVENAVAVRNVQEPFLQHRAIGIQRAD